MVICVYVRLSRASEEIFRFHAKKTNHFGYFEINFDCLGFFFLKLKNTIKKLRKTAKNTQKTAKMGKVLKKDPNLDKILTFYEKSRYLEIFKIS